MKADITKKQNQSKIVVKKDSTIEKQLDNIYSKKSSFWSDLEKKNLVSLFHATALHVEAYGLFLKNNNIKTKNIIHYEDFKQVPAVSKNNYLRVYPWEHLCKKGSLLGFPLVMTSTSGSTGAPFYFPRGVATDMNSALYHQMFMRSTNLKLNKPTLVIDCFAMGVWIGGLITFQAFKYISERGYPMTIITPGINKREIFEAIKNLGPKYGQIIMCGYPPFMKDVVDEAESHGVVWKNYSIKMVFAAESFSENFRDYIIKKVGMKNPYKDTMNIYGSADVGTMAEETPLCILVRRLAITHIGLYSKLFGQTVRLPTLAQYIPTCMSFEAVEGSIYCSADTALPLVRYDIGDTGLVLSFSELEEIFSKEGFDLRYEAKKVGIEDTISELPFVCIYERSDLSSTFYGVLIYPEYIKKGLQIESLEKSITGKFTMYTKNDENENQYLEINIELKQNQNETKALRKEVLAVVQDSLLQHSAEYRKIAEELKERSLPKIVFWNHEDIIHFRIGGKQKWAK